MTLSLKVLLASPEVTPLAQTGGLAEVAGSLPEALSGLGIKAAVIMPGYASALARCQCQDMGISLEVPMGAETVRGRLLSTELAPGVPAYLVSNEALFGREGLYAQGKLPYPDNPQRFAFFAKAVIQSLPLLPGGTPDICLGNDWQTGLIMPYLLEMGPGAPKGVFVIHNQGYLGLAPASAAQFIGLPLQYYGLEGLEYHGQLSYLKAGIVYGRAVVTVSPTYAREIQSPEGGGGLDGVLRLYSHKLKGILNGVDYKIWDPENDPHIPAPYSASDLSGKEINKKKLISELGLPLSPDRPLFSMVSRLTAQKGLTLIMEAAEELFRLGLNLAILGSGEPWYEDGLSSLARAFPRQMFLKIGYDVPLSHRLMAGSDFILVPSIYEPCGLVQLYGLRYGAIPVVRAIGGLNDTVRDFAGQNPDGLWDTGFKFTQFQSGALLRAVRRATELYGRREDFLAMASSNMREDFSWKNSARAYAELLEKIAQS